MKTETFVAEKNSSERETQALTHQKLFFGHAERKSVSLVAFIRAEQEKQASRIREKVS